MKRKSRGCLLVAIGIPSAFVAFVVCSFLYQFYMHANVREHITFLIPGTEIEVGHSRIGINPIMAEYDRDLTFIEGSKSVATAPLSVDTCGGYPINCYLIETSELFLLRLDDAVSEHLIDITNNVVNVITHAQGKAHYGKLNSEDSSSGWSIVGNDPSTLQVTIGGNVALPLDDLIGDATEKYLGRIDGKVGKLRFIPATEATEMRIDHLFDR